VIYSFYISGVDRTWDFWMASLNSFETGFNKSDELWNNVQNKMIKYIEDNVGHAVFYSNKKVSARPKYKDVVEYLMGIIPFSVIKK